MEQGSRSTEENPVGDGRRGNPKWKSQKVEKSGRRLGKGRCGNALKREWGEAQMRENE